MSEDVKKAVNELSTEDDQKELQRQIRDVQRALKRRLKHLSKGEIIAVCIDQALRENEMRNIAKQLFEENKELKGIKNEEETKESV